MPQAHFTELTIDLCFLRRDPIEIWGTIFQLDSWKLDVDAGSVFAFLFSDGVFPLMTTFLSLIARVLCTLVFDLKIFLRNNLKNLNETGLE